MFPLTVFHFFRFTWGAIAFFNGQAKAGAPLSSFMSGVSLDKHSIKQSQTLVQLHLEKNINRTALKAIRKIRTNYCFQTPFPTNPVPALEKYSSKMLYEFEYKNS